MTRLEVLGDDGQWHEVPGVASVELHEEQPVDPRDEVYRREHALDALVFSTPHIANVDTRARLERLREECVRAEESMRRIAGPPVIDQDGRLVPPDRPAWQSPYGPVRRRH